MPLRQRRLLHFKISLQLPDFALACQHPVQLALRRMETNTVAGKNMARARHQHRPARQLFTLSKTLGGILGHIDASQPVAQEYRGTAIRPGNVAGQWRHLNLRKA